MFGKSIEDPRPIAPQSDDHRRRWREIFGTSKEEGMQGTQPPVIPGGSFGRSMVSEPAAFKRLLQAMRSMAPGGWSDDRWAQSKAFIGIAYVAIHRICTQLQMAEFKVYEKDDNHPDGKRPVRRGHPGFVLNRILERPNKQDSFGKMMYRLGQQVSYRYRS